MSHLGHLCVGHSVNDRRMILFRFFCLGHSVNDRRMILFWFFVFCLYKYVLSIVWLVRNIYDKKATGPSPAVPVLTGSVTGPVNSIHYVFIPVFSMHTNIYDKLRINISRS
jgi:hypothetical protein